MRHAVVAAFGIALLAGLVVLPAGFHAPLAAACFALAYALDREVARGLGRPHRWLAIMAALVLLGVWLGPPDATLLGRKVSSAGGLAGVTMAARAVGLLLVTSALTKSIDPQALLARLGGTRAKPLAASVVVALRLAPELTRTVRERAARAEREAPGLARAPARAYATLVTILAHASSLAEDVARELEPSTTTTQSTMGDAKP